MKKRHCGNHNDEMYPIMPPMMPPMMQNPPGTVLRVYIPPGAVINLLNLFEVASPQGISLLVRVPFLGGSMGLENIMGSIMGAGGMVQPMDGSNYGYMNYYQPYYM